MDYRTLPPGRERMLRYSYYVRSITRNVPVSAAISRMFLAVTATIDSNNSWTENPAVSIALSEQFHNNIFFTNLIDIDHNGIISKNLIEKSKIYIFGKNKETKQCCICCDDFRNNNIVRELDCKHMFHINCVDTWFTEKKTCPECRFEI